LSVKDIGRIASLANWLILIDTFMVKLLFLFVCVIAFSLTSCEGFRCAVGPVYDRQTYMPIDSVLCESLTSNQRAYTDTKGQFKVCNNFGGCVPKCSDIIVRFSKQGYLPLELKNPSKDTIFLSR